MLLDAFVAVERAAARAAGACRLVPDEVAAAAAAACRPEVVDAGRLAAAWDADATPVVELVRALREAAGPGGRDGVHVVLTSQDVLDTALVLHVRDRAAAVLDDAVGLADALAGLAAAHRDSPQVGRTLLQHGAPTTFGLACAARLVAVEEAAATLRRDVAALPVQAGGAVGTLAPLATADDVAAFVGPLAAELGLAVPVLPWHTTRGPLARAVTALGVLAGEAAAVAQDVVLLSATELGEVAVAAPGGSSAMAHKRNPARAVLAVAAAHRVPGLVAGVLAGMPQPLQRSAGAWQAEVPTVLALLDATADAVRHARAAVTGLHVDTARMREHVDALLAATGGRLDTGAAAALVDAALTTRTDRT